MNQSSYLYKSSPDFYTSLPTQTQKPFHALRNKTNVLNVAQKWYAPERVSLNQEAILALPLGTIHPPLDAHLNLSVQEKPLIESVAFCVAVNAINYRFWNLENNSFIRYEYQGWVGALGMIQAFEQAWLDEQSTLRKAVDQQISLTETDIQTVFGPIPDIQGRMIILNEVLTHPEFWTICRRLENTIEQCQEFSTQHAALLAEFFPVAYADEVLKKAQLAIASIWREGMNHWRRRGVNVHLPCELTAFADYQIPNVLRALGVLRYADDLIQKIEQHSLIEEDSIDERALRAASLIAVEALAVAQKVQVADVDYWLWSNRKQPKSPFHLTMTTRY